MTKSGKGFTLLEVIIAIFILTVGVGGAYGLIQSTIISASQNKMRLTAYYLAQEGVEIVRNIRDSNWLAQRTAPGVLWADGILTVSGCIRPRFSPCDFYGDYNLDGVVTVDEDAYGCYYGCPAGPISGEICKRCDVDGNGSFSGILEALKIAQYAECTFGPDETFSICQTQAVFQKEIIINSMSPDILQIFSTVTWQERGKSRTVEVMSQLTNWK